jgi:hypothetical protein
MVFERGLILEELAPRGWLVVAATAFGFVVFVALLVLLLVTRGHFHNPPSRTVPTGSCYPFCTAGPPPYPPPPGWQ